ncbi:ABC transporter ATP-binding protein [Nissabacter sp. SGAir0207]|uniref:ABC transporter ATP-binding protein n=1 Tax=Nissabacter sp. SGAir0207 TaxID=2126321 RepID=UPI0010CD56BA|nr:sn-glycerol-3-phosphate ABC transporter ATP-binding protein UgpC [Nissabacter sp. SGAir0207]QCR37533.1 sugar ABC transporter ATP-binding protein [Nissabacter sp. SGAir0207]
MSGVILDRVTKCYQKSTVIEALSLTVQSGEFLVLVGPSGCGKSTLLRMIAGLEALTSGAVFINGNEVTHLPAGQRGLSMVFQSYALYPHMTVRQNLSFGLKNLHTPAAEIERRVQEATQMLGLEAVLDRLPQQLSGGQRQRVAIGRSIVQQPAVFLFDEPLSNLDAALRVQMRQEISRLHARLKNTMIYVTHDQVEAMTLADRIVLLNKGKVEQIGTPIELYNRPQNTFVAEFIGTPKINLLPAHWRDGQVRIDGQSPFTLRQPPASLQADQRLWVGIRPEHLRLEGAHDLTLAVEVEFTELQGDATLVYARAGELALKLKTPQQVRFPAGTTLQVGAEEASLLLFDEAGERLE